MSSNNDDFSHLTELGKSNYEVAAGESDIRTWVVKNENGNILGEVQDLIFDSHLRKVVFIILDLDRNELNLKERKVLIPLEYADINQAYKNVIVKGLMPNEVAALPTYEKGHISRNYLDQTMSTFISSQNTNVSTDRTGSTAAASASGADASRQSAASLSRETPRNTQSHESHALFTVVGVLEHSRQSQAAIEYLTNHGFGREDITVSSKQSDVGHDRHYQDESGISHFFKTLFRDENETKRYSDATASGVVITVDAESKERAEEAANILDQHGTINMSGTNTHATGEGLKANSRIFERNIDH
jgi:sporulation protein YlmC with PRC-barrel domain